MEHRASRSLMLVLIACLLLIGGIPAPRAMAASAIGSAYVEGEVVVKFKARNLRVHTAATVARLAHPQAVVARTMRDPFTGRAFAGVTLVRFPKSIPVESMVARYRAMPEVVYAEPNYIVSVNPLGQPGGRPVDARVRTGREFDARGVVETQALKPDRKTAASPYPNDPFYSWGWYWASAFTVWPDNKPSPEVAVIDTGVDALHPDLMGQVINGGDIINGDPVANDDYGHGTHVAGIISARIGNGLGISGVSRSRIFAIKALSAQGWGTNFDIAFGIFVAANRPTVKIINMSLGGPFSMLQHDAVQYAVGDAPSGKGKLLIAAAGNDTTTTKFYPAAFSVDFPGRVVAVAAEGTFVKGSADALDHFVEYCQAPYSNFGDWITIVAPGTDILSTTPYKKPFYLENFGFSRDGYNSLDGTSMATPHVAGIAARILSNNPGMTNVELFDRLVDRSVPVHFGSVDVDGDGTAEITNCWDAANPPTLGEANAGWGLGRSMVYTYFLDATTGLGLLGGQGTIVGPMPLGVGGDVPNEFSIALWVNVPWNTPATKYTLRFSKTGYTAGPQNVDVPPQGGVLVKPFDFASVVNHVSVPPNTPNYTFVTNWSPYAFYTDVDLDQYLFLPEPHPCSVGPSDLGASDCGVAGSVGSLLMSPFARWFRDGGGLDPIGVEATSVKTLFPTTPTNPYRVRVNTFNGNGTEFFSALSHPVVRLWRMGSVKATVRVDYADVDPSCVSEGGGNACPWWDVGTLSSTGVFTPINQVGDAPLPYGPARRGAAAPRKR
jgi:subtilisin family serine protease